MRITYGRERSKTADAVPDRPAPELIAIGNGQLRPLCVTLGLRSDARDGARQATLGAVRVREGGP